VKMFDADETRIIELPYGVTRSSAVAKRQRDASCLYSFNTKRRAQSFIISCFGFRYTTAY